MVVAEDVNEALNLLKTELIDLVIAEIHMKDIDGIELMQQIHREFNLPVACECVLYITYDINEYFNILTP